MRFLRAGAVLAVAVLAGACSGRETIRIHKPVPAAPAVDAVAGTGLLPAQALPVTEVASLPEPVPPAGERPTARVPAGDLKVGLLLPLSGPRERIGRDLLDAAQLAIFDLDAARLALIPIDTAGTPDGAAGAAAEAVERGAQLILGPLFAESVIAVAPAARAAGIPVVSFSNSARVGGDGVFAFGFDPVQQIEAVVAHATAAGLFRFAAIAPANAFGETVIGATRAAAEARGATLVRSLQTDPQTVDPTAGIKRLVGVVGETGPDFDAVLLAAEDQHLKTLASLLSYYDADYPKVRFLGLANWERTEDIEKEPALAKGWYAAPASGERGRFSERFQKVYGYSPVGIATLAYDAVALAAAFSGGDVESPELVQAGGFSGVDGLFRFDASGAVERAFEIREVGPGGFVVRRPAPTRFVEARN